MGYETYTAVSPALPGATPEVASALAASPFKIELRFGRGLTRAHKEAFTIAANRWTRVIVGDLPGVRVNREVIDDVLIHAEGVGLDGALGVLGQAGPTWLRPEKAGNAAYLPARGRMVFDKADLQRMQEEGTLVDVITHEMGHVLGIGAAVWSYKDLLKDIGGPDPTFHGPHAMEEYRRLRGGRKSAPVPVENIGGVGTRDCHWRDTVFGHELMSSFIGGAKNPLSRLTVASLKDLGYEVNMEAADAYALLDLLVRAESVLPALHAAPSSKVVLPIIPCVLPDDSLV